jgi:CRISPR-associated protein Cas2
MLSGYRFLWTQVIFDLPVTATEDRRAATQFRNHLLDLGFDMVQFSVYMKWVVGKEAAEVLINKVKTRLPEKGHVHILIITDKQYENIVTFLGRKSGKKMKNPDQLELF